MKYLLKIGLNAKKSYEKLKNVNHELIKSSLVLLITKVFKKIKIK